MAILNEGLDAGDRALGGADQIDPVRFASWLRFFYIAPPEAIPAYVDAMGQEGNAAFFAALPTVLEIFAAILDASTSLRTGFGREAVIAFDAAFVNGLDNIISAQP